MLPMETAPSPRAEEIRPVLQDAVKQVIVRRMMRHEPAARIAALIEQNFHIKVDREQMLACWYERHPPSTQSDPTRTGPGQNNESGPTRTEAPVASAPLEIAHDPIIRDTASGASQTQTERRQDKESVQLPEDAAGEPLFTCMPCAETPDAARPLAKTEATPATRTRPGQKQKSAPIPEAVVLPDAVREYVIDRMARHQAPWMIADAVERAFGRKMDRDEIIACWQDRDDAPATESGPTRTGPGQNKEPGPRLSDEVKTFIVKRLACYETPSRIAAAVRTGFGIAIDRRRVFDYNPAGARPPAQRWIDLHAATRAKFLRDVGEIGVAQKVVRLRMLDRFAQMAEDDYQYDRAARYLQQAARECGGFYERHRAPAAAATGSSPSA